MPHHQTPNTAIPTKTHTEPPKTHQAVTSQAVNSFELFDEMIDRLDEPITAETMKDYHRILKQGTADARWPSFAVGDFNLTRDTLVPWGL